MIDTAGGSTSATVEGAAIPAPSAPHLVNLACRCDGRPHPFDVVTLHEHVTNRMGIATAAVLNQNAGDAVAIESELAMVFIRYGIAHWSFVDANGPVYPGEPVAMALIERWLPWVDGGAEVLAAADSLYKREVFRPFQVPQPIRSPAGRKGRSTSARTRSGPTPLRPSRRSSPASTAGRPSER